MKIIRLSNIDLGRIKEDWNQLAGDNPFRSWSWLTAWWRHFGPVLGDVELLTLGVFDDQQRLIGLAPWYLHRSEAGHVIRPLGTLAEGVSLGDRSVSPDCGSHLAILADPHQEHAVASLLAEYLLAIHTGNNVSAQSQHNDMQWDTIELADHDLNDLMAFRLCDLLAERQFTHDQTAQSRCCSVELAVASSWCENITSPYEDESRVLASRLVPGSTIHFHFLKPQQPAAIASDFCNVSGNRLQPQNNAEQSFLADVMSPGAGERILFQARIDCEDGSMGVVHLLESDDTLYLYRMIPDAAMCERMSESDARLHLATGVLNWAMDAGYRRLDIFGAEPWLQSRLGARPCRNATLSIQTACHADKQHETIRRPHQAPQYSPLEMEL